MTDEAQEPEGSEQEAPNAEQQKPTETVEFWKAKAREQEKRAKENADAAKRLGEIEDASKTELQKANERAEQAERRAAEFESMALRSDVAASKGVPAAGLTGTTREELEASADALIAWRDASSTTTPAKTPPDPKSLKSGASGSSSGEKGRAAAALRSLRGA